MQPVRQGLPGLPADGEAIATRWRIPIYGYKLVRLKAPGSGSNFFMTDALVVLCTCSSREEAMRIAQTLVEERLAACVNVLPGVTSVYRWQGQVETAEEVLLVMKTAEQRFSQLCERIAALHSYEVPEIISLAVRLERKNIWPGCAASSSRLPAARSRIWFGDRSEMSRRGVCGYRKAGNWAARPPRRRLKTWLP